MANLIKEDMYIKSNVAENNNKFWHIQMYDDFTVHVRNGRVGGLGETQPVKQFDSQEAAEKFYDKKCKEKTSDRKGYVKAKVLLGASSTTTIEAPKGNLSNIALKQIDSSSSETAKLIKYLSDKNIHNITSATTMTYDESKGTFRTPLGIVTQDALDEARTLLNELVPFVEKSKYQDSVFIDKLQQYIQLIPRKVGRKLIAEEIFPDMDTFQKEGQILDALDASLQEVLTSSDDKDKDKPKEAKIFNVKLDVLEDMNEYERLRKYFDDTRNRHHASRDLNVKKIYTVDIKRMREEFEKKGKPIGNIMELFHGSRVENLLSILKGGLIIPKGNEPHVTGKMFSAGIYASNISSKATSYSIGAWGHGKWDTNCYCFIVDFAMGKYYVPSAPSQNLPKPGYNST
jgi:poly [ADP-ribose] polymerase